MLKTSQSKGGPSAAAYNGRVVFGWDRGSVGCVEAWLRRSRAAVLASNGLGPALVSASSDAPKPVSVSAHGLRRCRPEVESAVYFTRLAAIDIATKSRAPAGAGLTNMRDRITALGGSLAIDSKGLRAERGYTAACRTPG